MLIRIDEHTYRRPEDARISVLDHGFLFGDSVYEVLRTFGGRPYQVEPHLARLEASAAGISLAIGRSRAALAREIDEALAEAACTGEAYIRVIITRGIGDVGLDPASCERPSRVLIVKELDAWDPEFYRRGLSLRLVSTRRNARGTVDPAIKTGNYLNNVLAMIEARRAGADEALMQNVEGRLTECTTSNLFFVRAGVLCTPALEEGILSGITRSDTIRLARAAQIEVREGSYLAADLLAADEAFLTSTTRGLMPVAEVDGRPLGDPAHRPVLGRLQSLLGREIDAFVRGAQA